MLMNVLYGSDKAGQRGPFVLLGIFLWWLTVVRVSNLSQLYALYP